MIRVVETESQRVYNVGYAYPYYDEYTDRSATFRSSKLVWASSPEEAIQKIDDMKDKIYNDNLSMTDYPYDFEVLGSWDDMNEFKSQFPMSNIELMESAKVCEAKFSYDDYKYYVSISKETPNPEYMHYLRSEAKKSGIIPIWVSYKMNPSNGKRYMSSHGWVYLMKNKNDYETLKDIANNIIGHNYVISGPSEFDKSLFGIADKQEYLESKITESNEDKVFVMYEYTAYPEDGMEADDIYPLFIMDATNESEAKEEMDAYNWEHRDEVTRTHSYFYDIVTREEAEEMFGDDSQYEEKYMPVREALEDDPETADQEYSSAATSINSSKLPALFKMVKFDKGSLNLDYGGGKFDNVAEYLKSEYDATNLVYDPYNRSSEHNKEVLSQVRKNGGADTVTCSNVLNVIKEPEARLAVIKNCKNYLKSGGTAYFTCYEGTGKGDEGTTKSGYQLNRKTADYVSEIEQVFNNVVRKGKLIVAR